MSTLIGCRHLILPRDADLGGHSKYAYKHLSIQTGSRPQVGGIRPARSVKDQAGSLRRRSARLSDWPWSRWRPVGDPAARVQSALLTRLPLRSNTRPASRSRALSVVRFETARPFADRSSAASPASGDFWPSRWQRICHRFAECRPAGAFRIARAKSHRLATVASRPPLLSELMTRVLSILPQSRTLSESLGYFRSLREGQKRAGRTRDATLCCIIEQVSAPRKSCPPFACRSLIRLDPEIFLLCVHCVLCGSTLPRGEKTKKPQRARRTQRRARYKARCSGPAAEIREKSHFQRDKEVPPALAFIVRPACRITFREGALPAATLPR